MARLLRMPEVAANTLEATLSEWLVTEDAEFADGDAIATVETDKAAVEVPADGAGVLVRTLVGPGTTVEVGAPMALIAAPGETVADVDAALAELGGTVAPATVDDPDAPVRLAGQTPPTDVSGPPDPPPPDAPPPHGVRPGWRPPRSARSLVPRRPRRRRARPRTGRRRGSCPARWPVGSSASTDCGWRTSPAPARAAGSSGTTCGGPSPRASTRTQAAGRAGRAPSAIRSGRPDWEDVPHTRMRRAIAGRLAESNGRRRTSPSGGPPASTTCSRCGRSSTR